MNLCVSVFCFPTFLSLFFAPTCNKKVFFYITKQFCGNGASGHNWMGGNFCREKWLQTYKLIKEKKCKRRLSKIIKEVSKVFCRACRGLNILIRVIIKIGCVSSALDDRNNGWSNLLLGKCAKVHATEELVALDVL